MKCQYRYCRKDISYGRPDRKFCNKNCKIREDNLIKELKLLDRKVKKSKEFMIRADVIHHYKYNYDSIVYVNCRSKIKIICPTHGPFEQTPNNHLLGHGCEKCSRESRKILKIKQERLENIKIKHNNKYLYNDLSINDGYVKIMCPIHGTFSQYLYSHEHGKGCSKCYQRNT